jgi:Fe-S-cluster containining protein
MFKICLKLNISPEKFIKKYTDPANTWNVFDGHIKLDKSGNCPFLKKTPSGRFECSIYECRPNVCQNQQADSGQCSKDPSYLIDYIEQADVCGDELILRIQDPKNYSYYTKFDSDEKLNYFQYQFDIKDEILLNQINSIREYIENCDDAPVNPIEKEIIRAQDDIDNIIGNIDLLKEDPDYKTKVTNYREIVDQLAYEAAIHWREEKLVSKLKDSQKQLENLADTFCCSAEELEEPIDDKKRFLIKTNEYKIPSIALQPESIIIYSEDEEGFILPSSFPLNFNDSVMQAVRKLIKNLTWIEQDEIQEILTETSPPCYLCGECCSVYDVEIKPRDIIRAANHLKISESEFRSRYLKPARFYWNPYNGSMKTFNFFNNDKNYCTFIKKGKDNFYYCSIHNVKPEVCAKYPATDILCMKHNNPKYWYRLPNNILSVTVTPENLTLYTSYTCHNNQENYSFSWRDNHDISTSIKELLDVLQKAIHKNS